MNDTKIDKKLDYLHTSLHKTITGPNELHIKVNPTSNMVAIISVDRANPAYKSALGGTRYVYYSSIEEAILDAVKLSTTMTYKAKFADLPFNGGKAVLMKMPEETNRKQFFSEYGKFIDSLEGKIITGCDSGVTPEEMKIASENTRYITALPLEDNIDHLASFTVLSVLEAMKAASNFVFKKNSLSGLHIAVQGLGKVGYLLAEQLIELGARLTVTDINLKKACLLRDMYNVQIVEPSRIYHGEYDIFAPCGLGGIINHKTISTLKTKIICGSANNILDSEIMADVLYKQNVLYIPDFVSNVGGAVYAGNSYLGHPFEYTKEWIIKNIYNKLLSLLAYSSEHNLPCNRAIKDMIK